MTDRRGRRALAAAAAVLVSAATPASGLTLHWSNYLPAGHPILETVLKPWFAEIAKATDGRVRIRFHQAPWGPAPRQIDIVELQIRHAAFGGLAYTPHRFPVARIAELPFLSNSSEALSVAYWHTYRRHLAKTDEFAKALPLALAARTPGTLWAPEKAFARLDDLRATPLLVVDATASGIARRLGARPVLMPPPLARATVASGTVHGFLGMAETVRRHGLAAHLGKRTGFPAGLYANAYFVTVNPKFWRRILPGDRRAIMAISGARLARALGAAWDRDTAAVGAGVETTEADPRFVAAIRSRLAVLEARWRAGARAKGIDADTALRFLRAEIGREEAALGLRGGGRR